MNGWIALKRDILAHPLFREHPERLYVWVWILTNAAWRDERHDVHGKIMTIKRGQLCVSLRRVARETGLGLQVVRTTLDRLRDERAINTDTNAGRTIITICNYEKYQSANDGGNAATNTAATQQQHTNEQGNNSSEPKGSGASAPDPVKVMFDAGVRLMGDAGVSERQARSLIGKWKSKHGTEAVLSALGRAQREGALDPVAFVEGCLRHQAKGGYRKDGDRIEYADAFGGGPVVR